MSPHFLPVISNSPLSPTASATLFQSRCVSGRLAWSGCVGSQRAGRSLTSAISLCMSMCLRLYRPTENWAESETLGQPARRRKQSGILSCFFPFRFSPAMGIVGFSERMGGESGGEKDGRENKAKCAQNGMKIQPFRFIASFSLVYCFGF